VFWPFSLTLIHLSAWKGNSRKSIYSHLDKIA
jgi:hypothetical protein